MQRLLVSGLGFHPENVLRPAQECNVAGVLIVYGDHDRSVEAEATIRRELSDSWLRSVVVPDWDLRALNEELRHASSSAQEAMGGTNRVRLVVNMTAGHGFLHASLAQLASEGGHEMVVWRREEDHCVRASPYVVGTAELPLRANQMLVALHKHPGASVRHLARELHLASSTAYAAIRTLEQAGLVDRTAPGLTPTPHGQQWVQAHGSRPTTSKHQTVA